MLAKHFTSKSSSPRRISQISSTMICPFPSHETSFSASRCWDLGENRLHKYSEMGSDRLRNLVSSRWYQEESTIGSVTRNREGPESLAISYKRSNSSGVARLPPAVVTTCSNIHCRRSASGDFNSLRTQSQNGSPSTLPFPVPPHNE